MGMIIELTGTRFGRLVVTARLPNRSRHKPTWLCKCDCGREKAVISDSLRSGRTLSCGCYQKEIRDKSIANNAAQRITHGRQPAAIYAAWKSMRERCYNAKHKAFADYGGRGITVCDEWRRDFSAFRAWAVSSGFDHDLSLDRFPNNDGNYEPGNCRWATRLEQANNRRSSVRITVGDLTMTIAEHARIKGVPVSTVHRRWHRGIRGERLFARGRVSS